jgi:hypothetical protein
MTEPADVGAVAFVVATTAPAMIAAAIPIAVAAVAALFAIEAWSLPLSFIAGSRGSAILQ